MKPSPPTSRARASSPSAAARRSSCPRAGSMRFAPLRTRRCSAHGTPAAQLPGARPRGWDRTFGGAITCTRGREPRAQRRCGCSTSPAGRPPPPRDARRGATRSCASLARRLKFAERRKVEPRARCRRARRRENYSALSDRRRRRQSASTIHRTLLEYNPHGGAVQARPEQPARRRRPHVIDEASMLDLKRPPPASSRPTPETCSLPLRRRRQGPAALFDGAAQRRGNV